jgi:hypothetical protein
MPTPNNPASIEALDDTGLVDEQTMRKTIWPLNPYFIKKPTLRELVRRKEFPGVKIGGRYFFRIRDIIAFLKAKGVSAEQAAGPIQSRRNPKA